MNEWTNELTNGWVHKHKIQTIKRHALPLAQSQMSCNLPVQCKRSPNCISAAYIHFNHRNRVYIKSARVPVLCVGKTTVLAIKYRTANTCYCNQLFRIMTLNTSTRITFIQYLCFQIWKFACDFFPFRIQRFERLRIPTSTHTCTLKRFISRLYVCIECFWSTQWPCRLCSQ